MVTIAICIITHRSIEVFIHTEAKNWKEDYVAAQEVAKYQYVS